MSSKFYKIIFTSASFYSFGLGFALSRALKKPEIKEKIVEKQKTFFEEFDEKYGLPSKENLFQFQAYYSSLNFEKKIPNWTLQILSKEMINEKKLENEQVDRKHSKFSNNLTGVPEQFKAKNEDYLNSGWSRGHLAPASDSKHLTQEAMNETFLLNSNIIPQNLKNNQNYWKRFEIFIRRNVLNYFDRVFIVTGPLFLPIEEEDKKKYVKYQVIGENNVAVPTHLWKVILGEKDGERYLDAFVIPNTPIKKKHILEFRKDVSFIEKNTGLIFFEKVKPNKLICNQMECKLMKKEEYQEKIKEEDNINYNK